MEGTQRLFSRVRATVDTKAAQLPLPSFTVCVRVCVRACVSVHCASSSSFAGEEERKEERKEGRKGNVAKAIPRGRGERDMNYFGRIFSLSSSSSFSSSSFFRREETIGDCVFFFNF